MTGSDGGPMVVRRTFAFNRTVGSWSEGRQLSSIAVGVGRVQRAAGAGGLRMLLNAIRPQFLKYLLDRGEAVTRTTVTPAIFRYPVRVVDGDGRGPGSAG
jgi:hypothetical protein